jgi:hypothetical protein
LANQVTLTFAGDSKSLERTFSKVGADAIEMAGDLDKAQDRARSLDGAMGKVGSTVDSSESKFSGTADVLDGLAGTLGLNVDRQIELARGMGDIAGGLTNMAPLLSGVAGKLGLTTAATWAWNAAQTALNFVMSMNPIGLVVIAIGLLVAGFILAWKHSETFRDVVRGAMDKVKDGVGWVIDRFKDLWNFIKDLPGKIGDVFSNLADIVSGPFRKAFDLVKGLYNDTIGGFRIEVPSWVPGVGGKGFSFPRMHTGGVVPGNPGQTVPIMAMAGETIGRAGQGGGGGITIIVQGHVFDGHRLADIVQQELLRKQARSGSLGFN